jgi:lipoate-protein ligase B
MICHVHDLGNIEYQPAWELQTRLASEIAQGTRPNTLLLLEHPHTFTFGSRGQIGNLVWDEQKREKYAVSVRWVDRGGDVTYHGPGQLVGYPLIKLDRLKPVDYVHQLEIMLIAALFRLGLAAGQIKGRTGVWLQADIASRCPRCSPQDRKKPGKIAAIGVKVDANGISRHGFALNVDPDMEYFEGIIPCGISDHPVVSLGDIFPNPPAMEQVKTAVTQAFAETFNFEMVKQVFDFL